jgi:hypothetical protein
LTSINQCEVFGALDNKEYNIFDVENEWRAPIHSTVDITLGSSANNQVIMLHTHVYDPLSKVKIIIHFMKAVVDADSVFRI